MFKKQPENKPVRFEEGLNQKKSRSWLFAGYMLTGLFILIQAGLFFILVLRSISYQDKEGIIINTIFLSILFILGICVCKTAYEKR